MQKPPIFLICLWLPFLLIISTGEKSVHAICDYQPDGPDCACFDNTGQWDPSGGFIQDIALQTLGTRASCSCPGTLGCDWDPDSADPDVSFRNAGKPYYQMVLGCVEPFDAFSVAVLIDQGVNFHGRGAWCSETVSFWHKHTHIPYFEGYRTDWHPNWQIYSAVKLIEWYALEGLLENGRGRCIFYHQLDYEDFELGVTVPVPGSYVAIRGYDDSVPPGAWKSWRDTGHSLIINEMWVHLDAYDNPFQVEISLLEGNSDSRVRNDHKWDDILDLTPQGAAWLGSRKIFGFGVDLDDTGDPVFDPDRLHYEHHPYVFSTPLYASISVVDPEQDEKKFQRIAGYANKVRNAGGPKVITSNEKIVFQHLPDSQHPWTFNPDPGTVLIVDIDLLAEYPIPVNGVELVWDGGYLPAPYSVSYAGSDQKFTNANVQDYGQIQFPVPPKNFRVPVSFLKPGETVRYLRLSFYKGTFQQKAVLKELNLSIDTEGYEDAEINSNLTVTYPDAYGDVNGDRAITLADSLIAMQLSAGIKPDTGFYLRSDVNGDKAIGMAEVIYILDAIAEVHKP